MVIKVEYASCDEFIFYPGEKKKYTVKGCSQLLMLIKKYRDDHGDHLESWPLPKGRSHSELLLKEFILKSRGEWQNIFPFPEICHCRQVSTQQVEQSILGGAQTVEAVSLATTACTACGTCRADIENLIDQRLKVFD